MPWTPPARKTQITVRPPLKKFMDLRMQQALFTADNDMESINSIVVQKLQSSLVLFYCLLFFPFYFVLCFCFCTL